MAPSNKKGTSAKVSRDRRSASRHTTPTSVLPDSAASTPLTNISATVSTPPVAAPAMPKETPYLHAPTAAFIPADGTTLDSLIEAAAANVPISRIGDPPSFRELNILSEKIHNDILVRIRNRGDACERFLRSAAQKRKERKQIEDQNAEHAARAAKAAKEVGDSEKKARRLNKKRSRDEMEDEEDVAIKAEERREKEGVPSSVGVRGVTRQDGVGVHDGEIPAPPSPIIEPGVAIIDPMDTRPSTPSSAASDDEPAPVAPLYERAFGKDPSTCPDPTTYDIRPIYDDMSEDEKRAILNVAQWPESDLRHLTAGDPPDMDFSNAKPANQIHFATFQSYLEPYIRPFTEEDVAYLRERGDRIAPYLIPTRGPRTYKEVWAAEDGLSGIEAPRRDEPDVNVARGNMDEMNDEVAEENELSMGPFMNRLMTLIRPQAVVAKPANDDTTMMADGLNGDIPMTNGIDTSNGPMDAFEALMADPAPIDFGLQQPQQVFRPATALPADAPKLSSPSTVDFDTFETRALQELRYIGIVGPNETPNFAQHNDDEVAARLRTLQEELRNVAQRNNVRKALVLELTEERMAMQEYANIADDLDNQVNAAYLKRNRSLAKPSSKKGGQAQARAGQKGVASGILNPRSLSEGVRQLMEKRRNWIDMVGPVVAYGRAPIVNEGETIFSPDVLKRLEAAERDAEVEAADGE